MVEGYILVAEARSSQAALLEGALASLQHDVAQAAAGGTFSGPGPLFMGIGASYAAASSAVWVLRSRGIDAGRLNAGEQPLPLPASDHPVIGISQSGRSSETLAVLRSVDDRRRIAVVNVSPSPIADIATTSISLGNLPDSYASTTGFTATVAALGMIADAWDGGGIDSSWSALPALFRALEAELAARATTLAAPLARAESVDYAATAPSVGSAEVGALLLREIARVPASGFSTRQYLHGAMESAGRTAHVLLGDEREAKAAEMLSHAGHDVVLVTTLNVPEQPHLAVVRLPAVSPPQRAILEALVMQALAVEAALMRGLDPDSFVFNNTDTKVA